MWEVTLCREALEDAFQRYYNSIRMRRQRSKKVSIPRDYVKSIFFKWVEAQERQPAVPPGSVGVYCNILGSDARAIAGDMGMTYRKGKFYPDIRFLKYMELSKVNEVTRVSSMEQQLKLLKDRLQQQEARLDKQAAEVNDVKRKLAMTQQVTLVVVQQMIDAGLLEEVGLFPPSDDVKIERGVKYFEKQLNLLDT